MKRYLLFILTALLCLSASAASASDPVFAKAHPTTHTINMRPFLGGGKCSATAIAPHALLTASHCEAPTVKIEIDGKSAQIDGVIRDEQEHTILLVTATFTTWATLAKARPEIGDDVFIFGNAGQHIDFFRKGYVAKLAPTEQIREFGFGFPFAPPPTAPLFSIYDFNGWMGDSGSGIFNMQGEIVDVVSIADLTSPPPDRDNFPILKFMGAFPMKFTASDLDEAAKFEPKK